MDKSTSMFDLFVRCVGRYFETSFCHRGKLLSFDMLYRKEVRTFYVYDFSLIPDGHDGWFSPVIVYQLFYINNGKRVYLSMTKNELCKRFLASEAYFSLNK